MDMDRFTMYGSRKVYYVHIIHGLFRFDHTFVFQQKRMGFQMNQQIKKMNQSLIHTWKRKTNRVSKLWVFYFSLCEIKVD